MAVSPRASKAGVGVSKDRKGCLRTTGFGRKCLVSASEGHMSGLNLFKGKTSSRQLVPRKRQRLSLSMLAVHEPTFSKELMQDLPETHAKTPLHCYNHSTKKTA